MTAVNDEAVTTLNPESSVRTVAGGAAPAAAGVTIPAPRRGTDGDGRWRALLEMRWRDRLRELTEVCVAFHEAGNRALGHEPHSSLRALSRRAVTARYALAETDQALSRLVSGDFGRCEDCAGQIPAGLLRATPEARYCGRCAA